MLLFWRRYRCGCCKRQNIYKYSWVKKLPVLEPPKSDQQRWGIRRLTTSPSVNFKRTDGAIKI